MLDIKFIRENPEVVKKTVTDKRLMIDIDHLLELDSRRRQLISEIETLQATKNSVSKEIPNLSAEDKKAKILEMKEVDDKQAGLKLESISIEEEYQGLLLQTPNIPSAETPVGASDADNIPWIYWSPEFGHLDPKDAKVSQIGHSKNFPLKDHIALGVDLDLLDTEAGVKTAGFRGYYLKNEAVLMHYGLVWHAMKKLQSKGFTLMVPPVLVREFALFGSGHFPAGRDEVYRIGNPEDGGDHKEPLYLAGTSEPSLLAYFKDKILEEKDLPIKVCGVSQCFRSEVGSYGKDTKGIYRIHEFMKVEQVVLCKADLVESDKWLEALRETAQEILEDLKIPYRVLNICTGDMGAGKYKQYDVEAWMPARGSYGETHSDSNLTDWQSRRLNIRYRDAEGKTHLVYTLNNTAVASPRILIAILENYQQADGSIAVPDVLKQYVGVDVIKNVTKNA